MQTNTNNVQKALLPILQSEQVQCLIDRNFKALSESLPATIERALDQPPLSQLVKVSGEGSVKLAIEFELIKLSTLVSVGGNLTSAQVPFIAEQLFLQFPNESLADFKICFQRGATGCYGEIQRMDGVTIGVWVRKYLEEKYMALEKKMMSERDTPYQVIDLEKVASDETAKAYLDEMLKGLEANGKHVRGLSDEEIRREGKETPPKKKGTSYQPTFNERDIEAHKQYLRKQYPRATEAQINEIIESWKTGTINTK